MFFTAAVKTEVSVNDVTLDMAKGQAKITGLTVANPAGFTDPNIFELGNISTKIDISTLRKNPIVIDEVLIGAPVVVYEIDASGKSNVDVVKKNLGGSNSKSQQADSSGNSEALKMIIRKLVIEGSRAKVRIAALGNAGQSVNLPRIVLTDVGKKSGGATAREIAQLLSARLLDNVKGSVAKLGVNKYLGKAAGQLKQGALDKAGSIGNAVGGVTGTAGKAMKGLFGKP